VEIYRIGWKTFGIGHLNRRVIEYVQAALGDKPEQRYSVEVSYSDHCFTRRDEMGFRVFDRDRYEQSKLLPRIMSEMMSRECHHTGKTNFVTFDIDESRTYEVYFEVFKREGKLRIRVQSAYVRDKDRMSGQPLRSKIKFSTILFNVLHDRSIHPSGHKMRKRR
jgi:hypothetical protein